MSQPEPFEMLVLGSGEGGKFLAWHMAKSGHRTALVERKLIGGSCPHTHIPSRNTRDRRGKGAPASRRTGALLGISACPSANMENGLAAEPATVRPPNSPQPATY